MSITVIQLPEHLPVDLLENIQGYLSAGRFNLDIDWYGQRIEHPISIYLGANSSHLYLAAQRNAPATLAPGTCTGTFWEGLWNYEAVELFIGLSSSNAYLEVNLAPNGAWWCKTFSDYRVPTKEQPAYPVQAIEPLTAKYEARKQNAAQVDTFARSTAISNQMENKSNSVEGYWLSAIAIPMAHLLAFLHTDPYQPVASQTLIGQTVPAAKQPSCYDLLARKELLLNITAITHHPGLHYLSYNAPGSSCPPNFHLCALRKSCKCITLTDIAAGSC